ncbi:MAG: ferredoxin--NADP(+) reductase [Gammaproteobacteria bacterium]|nr:ferredoxin--NADP(+) reductase [Gammaproteobacteria bacterium]
MDKWVKGRVIAIRRWNEQLFSLQVDAEVAPFEAGQFSKLALDVDGVTIERPYSFVNAPADTPLEFYFIVVPDGPLSGHLSALQPGAAIRVLARAAGFLTLSEVPDGESLWLLSTGTGIGPFLSILKTDVPWRRFRQVVLVHAVRHASDLSYGDTIRDIAQDHSGQFRFIPFVSREDTGYALQARIPEAIADGRLQARAGVVLSADRSQVMLCGNPGMVRDTIEVLTALGLKKNRRRDPGQITMETYW